MSDAPERVWLCPDDEEWITGSWDRAPDGLPNEATYIHEDAHRAQIEAAVKRALEGAASAVDRQSARVDGTPYSVGGRVFSDAIRALDPAQFVDGDNNG